MIYDPSDHYWIINGGDLYSSARQSFIQEGDELLAAWSESGRVPTRIASSAELVEVLRLAGVPVGQVIDPPLTESDYAAAIADHLDATARLRHYDSILSAVSYDGDPVYGAEGAAAKAWRSAVWAYAYGEMAKVKAGQRTQPSVAELIAELPAMEWPNA